jgi:hypothetical protein
MNTFAVNAVTGYVEGQTEHVRVEVKGGRVVLSPTAAPNTWTDDDLNAYEAAQKKKETK